MNVNHKQIVSDILQVISTGGVNIKGHEALIKPEKIYDENGVSLVMTEFGGWRLRAVDELIDSEDWAGSKDPNRIQVAKNTDRNYAFLRPEPHDQLPEDLYNQIFANQGRLSFAQMHGMNVDDLYKMSGLYVNKITKDEIFTIPNIQQRETGNWDKMSWRLMSRIENHSVVGNGNFSHPRSRHWKTKFFDLIPQFVEYKMNSELKELEQADLIR